MPPILNHHRTASAAVLIAALLGSTQVHAQDFNPRNDVISRVIELQKPFQDAAKNLRPIWKQVSKQSANDWRRTQLLNSRLIKSTLQLKQSTK